MGLDGLGGILGGIGAVAKIGTGIYQNILAGKMHPVYNPYQISDYAKQKMGVAQSLFNGRAAGATANERNIYASGANSLRNINNNATDASQALALGATVQGQENQAFNNLGIEEDKNKYNMLDNLNAAYDSMTNEHRMQYQDMMKKYEMDTNTQNQLRGAGMSNLVGGINDAGSLAVQMDRYKKSKGLAGGIYGGSQYYGD